MTTTRLSDLPENATVARQPDREVVLTNAEGQEMHLENLVSLNITHKLPQNTFHYGGSTYGWDVGVSYYTIDVVFASDDEQAFSRIRGFLDQANTMARLRIANDGVILIDSTMVAEHMNVVREGNNFLITLRLITVQEPSNHEPKIPKIKKLKPVEFVVNDYITLKLEDGETCIYVNGENFRQCKFLLLNLETDKTYDEIEDIDQAAELLSGDMEHDHSIIQPEEEFWGHCSNLQAWVENDYDLRVIHTNLGFPLLRKLVKCGDKKALRVLKEEVSRRILKGGRNAFEMLDDDLTYFTTEEQDTLKALMLDDRECMATFLDFPLSIDHREVINKNMKSLMEQSDQYLLYGNATNTTFTPSDEGYGAPLGVVRGEEGTEYHERDHVPVSLNWQGEMINSIPPFNPMLPREDAVDAIGHAIESMGHISEDVISWNPRGNEKSTVISRIEEVNREHDDEES